QTVSSMDISPRFSVLSIAAPFVTALCCSGRPRGSTAIRDSIGGAEGLHRQIHEAVLRLEVISHVQAARPLAIVAGVVRPDGRAHDQPRRDAIFGRSPHVVSQARFAFTLVYPIAKARKFG